VSSYLEINGIKLEHMEDSDKGRTILVGIDRKFCPWIVLTTDLCGIKIENITNVLRRKIVYIFPTSMKVSEDVRKQGQKELTVASCNEDSVNASEVIGIRTLYRYPRPFLLVVPRCSEHPTRTALSGRSRLGYYEVPEPRDFHTLDHMYKTVAAVMR
jgi:hypothetical protein